MIEVDLVVPYDAGRAIGEIHKVHVISESYEGDGVHYRVRAPEAAIERIRDAALEGAVEEPCRVTRLPVPQHPVRGFGEMPGQRPNGLRVTLAPATRS